MKPKSKKRGDKIKKKNPPIITLLYWVFRINVPKITLYKKLVYLINPISRNSEKIGFIHPFEGKSSYIPIM